MRVSRRSFLGGAVGSLALLFGGFGWREPEEWEGDPSSNVPMTATEVQEGMSELEAHWQSIGEQFSDDYMTAFSKAQATAFDTYIMDPDAKILITTTEEA